MLKSQLFVWLIDILVEKGQIYQFLLDLGRNTYHNKTLTKTLVIMEPIANG